MMNYAAAINYFPKITYKRIKKISDFFKNFKLAWEAEFSDLIKVGWEEEIAHEFIEWRDKFSVEIITQELEEKEIQTLEIFSEKYPKLLKEISDPPPVIFYRGQLPSDQPAISIVGTRKCTPYGKLTTSVLSKKLASEGVVVVSGLALGIDGIAHDGALQEKGKTIAILGSGIDKNYIYPSLHQPLAERIVKNGGAILSEYPPNFKPTQYSFPARNRIIAGMSLGTVITEAPASSGALITAKFCLDYNREIFAFPHPITSPQGSGCNELIKKGAQLVSSAEEILDYLQIQYIKEPIKKDSPDNNIEKQIMDALKAGSLHVDEIIKTTGLPSSQINSSLIVMEMKKKVQNFGGMKYGLF